MDDLDIIRSLINEIGWKCSRTYHYGYIKYMYLYKQNNKLLTYLDDHVLKIENKTKSYVINLTCPNSTIKIARILKNFEKIINCANNY